MYGVKLRHVGIISRNSELPALPESFKKVNLNTFIKSGFYRAEFHWQHYRETAVDLQGDDIAFAIVDYSRAARG